MILPMRDVAFFSVLWLAECASLMAQERAQVPEVPNPPPAPAQPLPGEFAPSDLEGIDKMPTRVRAVIERASELSKKRLGYQYGSADPAAGAMDCSGTIFCLLREAGVADVPRQSDAIYRWVWQGSRVYQGTSCFGVGVFDFLEPRSGSGTARFVGYGPIPGLTVDPR
ncbi:MAG TPA: hypothetical protein PLU30_00105 [Verrucomicrobiae bacterium]|nr:hypothetical protein [Verrucomicrobiae bacterium]